MEIKEWAKAYKKLGFNVLPTTKTGKNPLVEKWENLQYDDAPLELSLFSNNTNIAILSHEKNVRFILVDIDDFDGLPDNADLDFYTLIEFTTKGVHLLFRADNVRPFSWIRTPYGEIRCTGYTIVTPSELDGVKRFWTFTTAQDAVDSVRTLSRQELVKKYRILTPQDFVSYADELPPLPDWVLNVINAHQKIRPQDPNVKQSPVRADLTKTISKNVFDILKNYYKPGHRHVIILHLAALIRKSHQQFNQAEAEEILKPLLNIDDEVKDRLKAIETTYQKHPDEINYSNLLTELAMITGDEDLARTLYHQLWQLFKPPKMEFSNEHIIEYKRLVKHTLYIIIDFNHDRVFIGRKNNKDSTIVKVQDVLSIAPVEFVVYNDLLTEAIVRNELVSAEEDLVPKNQLTIVFKDRGLLSQESAKDIKTLAQKLAEKGYVLVDKEKLDVLNFIFDYYKSRGNVKTETKLPYRGVFYLNNRFVVNAPQFKGFNREASRQALLLFSDFVERFYVNTPHLKVLVFELCWAIGSLLSFSYKMLGKHGGKFLFKFGRSSTGKTAISKVWGYILGQPHQAELSGSRSFSFASFSNLVSTGGFPIAINEPEVFLNDKSTQGEKIIATLKAYPETITLRLFSRDGNRYTQYTLAPIAFNSNVAPPSEQAFSKRCYVVSMKEQQILDPDKILEYNNFIQQHAKHFIEIGKAIAQVIEQLRLDMLRFDIVEDGYLLWREVYSLCGLPFPEWFKLEYDVAEDSMSYGATQELTSFRKRALELILTTAKTTSNPTPELRAQRMDDLLKNIFTKNVLMNYFYCPQRQTEHLDIFYDFFKEFGWEMSMRQISERLASYGLPNSFKVSYGNATRHGARIRVNLREFINWLIGYDSHELEKELHEEMIEEEPEEIENEPKVIGETLIDNDRTMLTILNDPNFVTPETRQFVLNHPNREDLIRQLYELYESNPFGPYWQPLTPKDIEEQFI